ncbi:unnamed protein product [Prunus armeniaca]|uniref:Uncharacterized protein n=1 Tax=Prunus armeniaca TaxID=36596 RepID=A0A6J5WFZ8_PRUAR|nr:unnamed protein product [Prunus armeniaca]
MIKECMEDAPEKHGVKLWMPLPSKQGSSCCTAGSSGEDYLPVIAYYYLPCATWRNSCRLLPRK